MAFKFFARDEAVVDQIRRAGKGYARQAQDESKASLPAWVQGECASRREYNSEVNARWARRRGGR